MSAQDQLKTILKGGAKNVAKSVVDLAVLNAAVEIDQQREKEYQDVEKDYQKKL